MVRYVRPQEYDVEVVLAGKGKDSNDVAEGNGLVETSVIAGNAKNCLKKRQKGCFHYSVLQSTFYLPLQIS